MKTQTCTTPSGPFTVRTPDCIGTFYIVYAPAFKERVLVNCIDATPDGRPKRMRVQQNLPHGGDVLGPGEYEILEKDVRWED